MAKMKIHRTFVFLLGFSLLAQGLPNFSFEHQEQSAIAFFSTVEQKKKLLEKLQADLAAFQKTFPAEHSKLSNRIAVLSDHIAKINPSGRNEQEEALKNKKATGLSELKQTLIAHLELLREMEETKELHIKVIREYLAQQNTPSSKKKTRLAYSWQELQEAQTEVSDLATKFELEKKKKEDLLKQKTAESEAITSFEKRLEVQTKEKKSQSDSRSQQGYILRLNNELFDIETQLLQEKINLAKEKIIKLDDELALKTDEVEFLDHELATKKSSLGLMEKGLSLTSYDVEAAKTEANLANQRSIRTKEAFNKKIDAKKSEKSLLSTEKTTLERRLKGAPTEYGTAGTVDYHLNRSEIHKLKNLIDSCDREIDLLTIKRDLAGIAVQNKELVAHDVEMRYKLYHGKTSASDLLSTFKNQRDIAQNAYKKIKDRHHEIMRSYGDRSRAIEDAKAIQEKIMGLEDTLFIHSREQFDKILANLDKSKETIASWFMATQEYAALSTDYLGKFEKILGQYNLIIENFQSYGNLLSLWKRTPHSLGENDIVQACNETETILRRLFFDAPRHLSPSKSLLGIKKSISWFHLLIFFGLIILFGLCAFLVRYLISLAMRALRNFQSQNKGDKSLLYSTIVMGLLGFFHRHFTLIGTWLFFYYNLILGAPAYLRIIRPSALPYYTAIFYFLSIPLFIYFSYSLISSLKELNKKISFLPFPDGFQERIEFLVAAVCYLSAVILPLRQALWHILPHPSLALSSIAWAVYVVLLIVVCAFTFNKNHVLYFFPDGSGIWSWIKKKLETFYYPLTTFIAVLAILSRPFLGFSNLATFLSYTIPLTFLVIYAALVCHQYIRKYAIFLFMKGSEEEITDKFEYAKTYYGFFVIFSFFFLLLGCAFFIARVWGLEVTPSDFWKYLSETLVIPIGVDGKLGFFQLVTLILFVVGGFFSSSLIQQFVLNKLFDILRTEPGTQNTVTKIFHYLVISLSLLLGFVSIHLAQLIWYVGTTLAVGLGFALKDILADYAAGLFVLIERPIEIGNYVRLDNNPEFQGVVHKIDARTTTIMNRLNHSLIFSNKDLVTKMVSNWGKGRFAVGFEVKIVVDYSSNIDEVKKAILEVLQSNPVILRVPSIIVRLDDFEESGLYFLARAFISARRVQDQWNIAAALREELLKTFTAKNIRFGHPQRIITFNGQQGTGVGPVSFNFEQ